MEEKKKSHLPVILAIVFVLILIGLYAYLYLLPQISGSRAENSVVSFASIQESAQLKCIIAREESVYRSGGAGSVSFYVEEGTKTRKGTKVADVYADSRKSFLAEKTGFISFYLDGMEEYFNPSGFADLDPDAIARMDSIVPEFTQPKELAEDKPLFKLVSSDIWYVLMLVPKDLQYQYSIGQQLTVEFEKDVSVPARVSYIKDGQDYRLVCAEVSRWYDKMLQLRSVEANIISSTTEGLLIPSEAIATNGENYGVYVQGLDGEYSFRTIEVLIEGPENTLIASGGQVKLYDEVLKDASKYDKK